MYFPLFSRICNPYAINEHVPCKDWTVDLSRNMTTVRLALLKAVALDAAIVSQMGVRGDMTSHAHNRFHHARIGANVRTDTNLRFRHARICANMRTGPDCRLRNRRAGANKSPTCNDSFSLQFYPTLGGVNGRTRPDRDALVNVLGIHEPSKSNSRVPAFDPRGLWELIAARRTSVRRVDACPINEQRSITVEILSALQRDRPIFSQFQRAHSWPLDTNIP